MYGQLFSAAPNLNGLRIDVGNVFTDLLQREVQCIIVNPVQPILGYIEFKVALISTLVDPVVSERLCAGSNGPKQKECYPRIGFHIGFLLIATRKLNTLE